MFFEKITCSFATHVIPEGEGIKEKLRHYSITHKELEVIHFGNVNGVDTDYFSASHFNLETRQKIRKEYNISTNDLVFVFVGRMVKDKGVEELVNAFVEIQKQHHSTTLLLIGPYEPDLDPLPYYIHESIEANPKIISVGFQDDVRPFLAIGDVFVLPSYREGFPNVLLQAGSMGLPAIVTDISGCNEIIKNKENGLIIPPKDKDSLYLSMKMVRENSSLRKKLKVMARRRIKTYYESRDVWDKLKVKYESLLDELQ